MKLKGIKGRGKRPTVGRKQSFSIKNYMEKPHVIKVDSLNEDVMTQVKDVAKGFVNSIIEAEIMRHGVMNRVSGKKDKELGYGIVIANMSTRDLIAPIAFKQDQDALEFSQYVYRIYLRKNYTYFESALDTLDPQREQCKELENVLMGFEKMIKEDLEKVKLPTKWS